MSFKYITSLTTPNRWAGGNSRDSITIHWWGAPKNYQSGDARAIANYLCRAASQASAHFVVSGNSAGRGPEVYGLAACSDRAWHAGDYTGNSTSIGIELCPLLRPEDIETAAELLAVLYHWYPSLRSKKLRPHNSWVPTQCPGDWAARLDYLRDRAIALMPYVNPDAPGKTLSAAPIDKYPKTPGSTQTVAEDGWIGQASVRALQKLLGTRIDGLISGQYKPNAKYLPRLTSVEYSDGGSRAVIALQKRIGVTPDGYLGEKTVRAWQRKAGVTPDGYLGEKTAKAIQKALNRGKLW